MTEARESRAIDFWAGETENYVSLFDFWGHLPSLTRVRVQRLESAPDFCHLNATGCGATP